MPENECRAYAPTLDLPPTEFRASGSLLSSMNDILVCSSSRNDFLNERFYSNYRNTRYNNFKIKSNSLKILIALILYLNIKVNMCI